MEWLPWMAFGCSYMTHVVIKIHPSFPWDSSFFKPLGPVRLQCLQYSQGGPCVSHAPCWWAMCFSWPMTHPEKKKKRNGLKTASLKRPLIVKCQPKTLIYISGVEEQYSNTGELFFSDPWIANDTINAAKTISQGGQRSTLELKCPAHPTR